MFLISAKEKRKKKKRKEKRRIQAGKFNCLVSPRNKPINYSLSKPDKQRQLFAVKGYGKDKIAVLLYCMYSIEGVIHIFKITLIKEVSRIASEDELWQSWVS